jgi:UDP-glucose 4-epimerase
MTVLVTGGAGYIGSHMVYALFAAGERVIVLDNLSTGFDWAVAAGVPLVVGETGDQNLVSTIIKEPRSSPSFILRLDCGTRLGRRPAPLLQKQRSTLAR